MLLNKQFKLAESTAKRNRGVTRLRVLKQQQGCLRLFHLLSLHLQDFTHSGHEDTQHGRAKQGSKERLEKSYLISLFALFVMTRVC